MRNIYLLLIGLGLVACSPTPSATATPSPEINVAQSCESIVEQSLLNLESACNEVGRNEACYGNRLINVELRDGADAAFDEPGDRIPIASIASLSLSPMNEANGEWGFALMQVQADLPSTLPGQNVTFLLFGGTEITPEGEVDGLQAFYVRTGIGATSACNAIPEDGLLIQSPEGDIRAAFSLNGVRFELGSTAYVTADASMRVRLLEGEAVIEAAGESQTVSAGQESSVALDTEGLASSVPSVPIAYETSHLQELPLENLPRPIDAAPALDSRPTATESLSFNLDLITEFATADQPDLAIISGEIVKAGEVDVYHFESAGNQAIYIDAQAMEGDIRINLTSPSERLLLNQYWLGVDYGVLLLDEAGRYTLEVEGHEDSLGSYQLQFWNVPAPNRFHAELSPPLPNNHEGFLEGILVSPASKDIYEFMAERGQIIFVDAQAMEGDLRVSLISPNESLLLNQHWLGIDAEPVRLVESGIYRLEVFGYMDAVGTYQLELWDVPEPIQDETVIAQALPDNQEGLRSGEIASPASQHIYEFTGGAGQVIFFDSQAMEGDIRATITSPDGSLLLNQHWMGIDAAVIRLPQRGRYTLTIAGYLDSVGTYQFQIWDVPEAESSAITIARDESSREGLMRGAIVSPATSQLYTFEARAGQRIYLALIEIEGDMRASLISPDGAILLNSYWLGIDSEPIDLPSTGTYSIRIHGNLDALGTYALQLRAVSQR